MKVEVRIQRNVGSAKVRIRKRRGVKKEEEEKEDDVRASRR